MVNVAHLRMGVRRELWKHVDAIVIIEPVHLEPAEQFVLRGKVVVRPSRENIVSDMRGRVKQEARRVQTIPRRWTVARRRPGIQERQERCIRSHSLRINRLQLSCGGRLDDSVHVYVFQLAATQRVARYHLPNLSGNSVPAPFVVKKEEQ